MSRSRKEFRVARSQEPGARSRKEFRVASPSLPPCNRLSSRVFKLRSEYQPNINRLTMNLRI